MPHASDPPLRGKGQALAGQGKREFGQGPLYRVTAAVYGLLATSACFLIACVPFIAAVLLTRLVVVIVVAGFCIGPAWVAVLYVMRAYLGSRDIEPVRLFWRGYQASWRQALLFFVPYFALVMILGFDLFGAGGAQGAFRWILIVLGALCLLWGSTVLLIISSFSFRLRDVLRLAVYGLVRSPRWLIADAALLVVTAGIVTAWSEAAAGVLAAPIGLFAVLNSAPMRERLRAEFTAEKRAMGDALDDAAGDAEPPQPQV